MEWGRGENEWSQSQRLACPDNASEGYNTEGCNPHRLHGLGTASRGYFWEAPTFKDHSSTALLSVRHTSVFISYICTFYLELQSALFDQSGK